MGLAEEGLVENVSGSFDVLGLGAKLDLIPWELLFCNQSDNEKKPMQQLGLKDITESHRRRIVLTRQPQPIRRRTSSHDRNR